MEVSEILVSVVKLDLLELQDSQGLLDLLDNLVKEDRQGNLVCQVLKDLRENQGKTAHMVSLF